MLALALLVVILMGVTAWLLPSGEDFRTDNPSWNGMKDVSVLVSATSLASLDELPLAPEETAVILVPYLEFTPEELVQLEQYIENGGTLYLADDYGYGNQALERLGVSARFSGEILLDQLSHYNSQWLPRLSRFNDDPLFEDVDSMVLNNATVLTGVEAEDVLAYSSSFSFLDSNENEELDEGEVTGPLPVMASYSLGQGRVVLIADPSLFINGMYEQDENLTFIQNMSASAEVYIDQSHLAPSNLDEAKGALAVWRSFFVTPEGTVAMAAAALVLMPVLLWPRRRELSKPNGKGEK